jgi:hypothetical protein
MSCRTLSLSHTSSKTGTATCENGDQKMNIKSAKEARNTTIYFIDGAGNIDSDSLFNFVSDSAEKVTSPRGIWTKIFVEETTVLQDLLESDPAYIEGENEQKKVEKFGLFEWAGGQKKRLIQAYDTQEEALDQWYTRTYNYDFMEDDQRDTQYFLSRAEAEGHKRSLYPEIEE